jgi:2-(1,2-epoxy-1,2-dihydrophenyl)acetyl-CoA isomerase
MTTSPVLFRREGPVGVITLNRPERLNALDAAAYAALQGALMAAAAPEVRAVILTGNGRAFCAGGDLAAMPDDDPAADLRFVDGCIRSLLALEKPTIAALNGVVAGGGLGLALACDWRMAGTSARLVPAFLQVGLVPDLGASWFLYRILGYERALDWLCSGRKLDTREALELGLVNEQVNDEVLMERALSLAGERAAGPTRAIALTKALLRQAGQADLASQLDSEARCQALAGQTADYREALEAFRAKREPRFSGN